MHLKRHTEGLVLMSKNYGEANKIYFIFTREFGLVKASGRSVRESKSKLKSSLVDYSFGRFTFIRTKNGWKITDALPSWNVYFHFRANSGFSIFARSVILLQKLLPEDEQQSELFDSFLNDVKTLFSQNFSTENLKNFECIMVLKILGYLGYLDKTGPWRSFIEDHNLALKDLGTFSALRLNAVREINQSLKASQLI